MTVAFTELRAAAVPVSRSCALLGRARATHYRQARGPVHGPRPARLVPERTPEQKDSKPWATPTTSTRTCRYSHFLQRGVRWFSDELLERLAAAGVDPITPAHTAVLAYLGKR